MRELLRLLFNHDHLHSRQQDLRSVQNDLCLPKLHHLHFVEQSEKWCDCGGDKGLRTERLGLWAGQITVLSKDGQSGACDGVETGQLESVVSCMQ